MNEENTKYLFEKYPKIFVNKDKSMQESCMHWGIECGDGWYDILDSLCLNIQHRCDQDEYVPNVGVWEIRAINLWNRTIWKWFINKPSYHYFVGRHNFKKAYIVNGKDPEYVRYSNQWKKLTDFRKKWNPRVKFVESGKKIYNQVTFEQVKEKFGTLRIYADYADDYVAGMIRMAEAWSALTCEACGSMDKTVKPNPGSWIAIRCDKCRKKKKK